MSNLTGRLEGKVALISGGAKGIGRATAIKFAAEGASVLIGDLDISGAEDIVESSNGAIRATHLDVANQHDWEAATELAIAHFGKLDIVCNVAGLGIAGNIEQLKIDDFQKMISVNVIGTTLGCQVGLRAILASGGHGALINVSSVAGLIGPSDITAYAATKGAVTLLTKSVALHLAERRYPVRCVAIHPGYVDTAMLDDAANAIGGRDAMRLIMGKLVPIGRICQPEEIASAIAFAASDEAAMITGSGIIIDGGQLAGPVPAHSG